MGVILLTLFILLFVSGLFLVMYYKPDAQMAFDSVNYTIMHEVEYGWLWRHIHAVGIVDYIFNHIHTFTAVYYRSYKNGREIIWVSGIVLFLDIP